MQAILNNDINEFKKNYNAAIITPKTIITIIKNGQIDFLKYLNTRGNLYCNCLIYAAKYNNLEIFKWLYEQGHIVNKQIYHCVAYRPKILKFLIEKKCPPETINYIAAAGSITGMKLLYAIYKDMQNACFYATLNGHLECVKYALECGNVCSFGDYKKILCSIEELKERKKINEAAAICVCFEQVFKAKPIYGSKWLYYKMCDLGFYYLFE